MNKTSGYLVETKTGLNGRTYHNEQPINGKTSVHVDVGNKIIKMLCDPDSLKLKLKGFID